MDDSSTSVVMSNRISWRKFDKIRKSQILENSTTSSPNENVLSDDITPTPKRKHGSLTVLSETTKAALLAEAQTWSNDKAVNWSSLAQQHGLLKPNGGQTVKEFMKVNNIQAPLKPKALTRSVRRRWKALPGGVPFPMPHHSDFHRKALQSIDINLGVSIVPASIPSLSFNKANNQIVESTSTVYAKKIPLCCKVLHGKILPIAHCFSLT